MISEKSNENDKILEQLEININSYLDEKLREGLLRKELYQQAKDNTIINVKDWLNDEFICKHSPGIRNGIFNAIKEKRWEDIVSAFSSEIAFGTTGIRGLACYSQKDVDMLHECGIDAPIIRGPNTINDIEYLLKSASLAKYAIANGLKSVAIGYDSRIRGEEFAELIAKAFLGYGLKVFLFDEACPYPELTFSIPTVGAELGVLISASHNDKRYNGYKICSKSGAQIDVVTRNQIYLDFISKITTSDIKLKELKNAGDKLVFLGGSEKIPGKNYFGSELIDMHTKHINHIKQFILDKDMLAKWVGDLSVGYCAFYGAGCKSVPRILGELGIKGLSIVNEMNRLDGTFPCFHLYQQPDPGDPVAANISVENFKKEYSDEKFKETDIMVTTDPDADRTGLVVKVPDNQKEIYKEISQYSQSMENGLKEMLPGHKKRTDYDWYLLSSDDSLSILFWYRLHKMRELNNGKIPDVEKSFIAINATTTDALTKLAAKNGIGVVQSWVGFVFLSKCVDLVWEGMPLDPVKQHDFLFKTYNMDKNRSINIGIMEQSSGFTILGGKPLPGQFIGVNGNTRDKDGILTSSLFIELLAYAKSVGKSIIELLDEHVYLDPEVGLFATYVENSPYWGQFEGPTGLSKKIGILKKADSIYDKFNNGEGLTIAGKEVKSIKRYATGKYDEVHLWKGFPDEGFQFYFDDEELNFVIARASGNSHCIRFHVQLHSQPTRDNLFETKKSQYNKAKEIAAELRRMCGA